MKPVESLILHDVFGLEELPNLLGILRQALLCQRSKQAALKTCPRWSIGLMVCVNGVFDLGINGVYSGYNPLIP